MAIARLLDFEDKTFTPRKRAPAVYHQCAYCLAPFLGVRQKRYCSKSCTEAAYRVRRSALLDALTLQFAAYGLSRANLERCAKEDLERCQKIALALGLEYFERHRVWETRHQARVLYDATYAPWRA